MDGYSVNEAAAVLGIPEGRVWELLARGVLAGSTEVGGDMRVILRGSAVPEAVTPAPAANGGHGTQGGTNGGSNGGELSAFRELLTEFRNLTERYGQALLALGEARQQGRLQPGDTVVLASFGAGLTWAAVALEVAA